MKSGEILFAFLIGSFLYSLLEIASRGYTHWSMTITGGICLAFIYYVATCTEMRTVTKCTAAAVFITSAEFSVGCIVNLKMKWNVWDYSDIPFNVMGQICLPYTVLWFVLGYAGYRISLQLNEKLSDRL